MRAGRGIGEEHLHIACANILGVQLVGASGIPGDAAHDFERIAVVEALRGQSVGVVQDQRHFGEVARRSGGSPGKDHVFHPATAHRCRPVFPHDPAERFEQVGLATAVRPDHACQTVRDDQVGRVNEAFEAVQT